MMDFHDGLQHIFPEDFLKLYQKEPIILLDIREPYELIDLPIHQAKNIPLQTLLNNYQDILSKKDEYYIICHHGQRSYYVTEILHNKGYNVINVVGGIDLVNRFDRLKR
jgi:rhodanese-related sulfurtransferase